MDAATIKGVVGRLVNRRLVTTAPSAEDRRRLIVDLTPEGRALFERAARPGLRGDPPHPRAAVARRAGAVPRAAAQAGLTPRPNARRAVAHPAARPLQSCPRRDKARARARRETGMRPVVLCILDGWGLSPAREAQRRRARRHAELRPDLGDLPARAAGRARARRRPARGADGQLRGRPHQHRRRPGGLDGPAAHRQRHRRRQLRRRTPRSRPSSRRSGRARARRTSPGSPRRAACTPTSARSPPRRAAIAAAGVHGRGARLPRRPRRSAAERRRPDRRARGGAARGRAHRHGQRPLLRHGPRQALGPGGARRSRRSCTPRASMPRARRRRSPPPTPAARPTSSSRRR